MNIKHEDLAALARGLAPVVHQHVEKALAPLAERIATLERQTAEIQTRGLAYRGTHQRAERYGRGDVVTRGGSLWIALRTIEDGEIPGSSDLWQLAVKGSR